MPYLRPGVFVEEELRDTPGVVVPPDGTGAIVAPHRRGPTEPVVLQSYTEARTKFGSVTEGRRFFQALEHYFQNGGTSLVAFRVAASDATLATVTVLDSGGTIDVITVDALNVGTWGNNISVDITNNTDEGRFLMTVSYNGTQVETFDDLSTDPEDNKYAEYVSSNFVTITVDTDNETPVDGSATLTGGGDGGHDTITDDEIVTAVEEGLDTVDRPITLNVPEVTAAAQVNLLLNWASTNGNFLIIDPPSNNTVADILTYVDSLDNNSHGALYYPRVKVQKTPRPGATRLVPPGPFVLAEAVGGKPWEAPAGLDSTLASVVGLERKLTPSNLDDLNQSHVNAIRNIPGSGVVVMGARTLRSGSAARYVPVRRMLNFLSFALKENTTWALFEPNDDTLWNLVSQTLRKFLRGVHGEGGLRGSEDEAYFVQCDGELNTPAVIESGQLKIKVGVALQFPAEFIIITLSQHEVGAETEESV